MTLNHIYRLVWSDVQESWIAVSEITKTHGKRHSRAMRLALSLLLLPAGAFAQVAPTTVVPTGSGTSAYVSANGTPIVNIKATNAAGLSHNQFLTYNVDSKGLVLNNGNASTIERVSKLAGSVLANPNLNSEARVILNEVVSTNRSTLAGYTEVVGGKADVVVANPNGITCSGCGFINTDRATLTTGTPQFGSNGGLSGFVVERGDILVTGDGTARSYGLDATAQQTLDLVARSVKLDAPVITSANGSLQLTAGTNRWSYDTRSVTGSVAGSGAAPAYAIDSTMVGGMYAGRIRLIATEAGVGVRMLGEAAASADDFRISSEGKLEIRGKLRGETGLDIVTNASGAGALTVASGELVSRGGMTLNAASGDAVIDGSTVVAADNLSGRFGSLTIGANTQSTLFANTMYLETASDLAVLSAVLRSSSDLELKSTAGNIGNTGLVLAGNKLTVKADQSIFNAQSGALSSLGDVDMTATHGDIQNLGDMYAGANLSATSENGSFTNTYTIGSDSSGNPTYSANGSIRAEAGDITIKTASFANNSWIEAGRDVSITSRTGFVNQMKGSIPSKRYVYTLSTASQLVHEEDEHDVDPDWLACDYCGHIWVYRDVIDRSEVYNAPVPTTAEKLIAIVAGRDLKISFGAGTAANVGAILYGGRDVVVSGSGAFSNADMTLSKDKLERRWLTLKWDAFNEDVHYFYYAATNDAQTSAGGWPYFTTFGSLFQYEWPQGEWSQVAMVYSADPINSYVQRARESAYLKFDSAYPSTLVRGANITAATGSYIRNGGTQTNGSSTRPLAQGEYDPLSDSRRNVPDNPNGYFVPVDNPDARYVIESNPLYGLGSNTSGSDALLKLLGIDPDKSLKRLGDANYEAYLIRQQLLTQTGNKLLAGYEDEAKQLAGLWEQTASESQAQGLKIGQPLSKEQISNLKQDIVWMVETKYKGQTVLSPVVYLAPASRASIASGAVISGHEIAMNVTSLSNTGGTIAATGGLNVVSQGDIANTGGTIKGGDVALRSTEGSVINRTTTEEYGYTTITGKTAEITSGNTLAIDAKKDIEVRGASVKAGGDASLSAGGNITTDSVVVKQTTATLEDGLTESRKLTKTVAEKNVQSVIATGGNLQLKSGGDTTLAGTRATVGGNLDVDSGGNFSILARQDKTTSHSESERSGFGVGGGVWGSEKTTVDDYQAKNVASSLSVGGDAAIKAGKDMTLQGSDLAISGSGKIEAESVKILEGKDEHRTVTKTETTTFLSTGSTTGSSATAAAGASSGQAGVAAEASASAGASESSEVNLMEKRTTTVDYSKTTGVGSRLSTGGDLAIKARETATVQGSSVEAGKDLSVDAKRIEVLAGTNEEKTTTTTSATKIGIYTDSKADASADAGASATGMSASTRASASANAAGESTATIGTRVEESTTQTTDVTHTAASLKSGGDMSLKAKEEAKFVGAKVEAGRDLNIEAKDITNLAAEDSKVTTSSSTTTTAGIYLSGEASAKAEAEAKGGAGLLGAGAKAEAEASAEAGAGLRVAREEKTSEQGATRNVVSTFKAGRDISRQASGTITDQGTQLEAGQDIKQSATTIEEIAAEDKTWSKESTEKHDARVGVYAGASAKAGAEAQGGALGKNAEATAEADASAGVKAKYTYDKTTSESSSGTAVTSRYKAGRSISSSSTDKTTLIGTQFEAGKDVNIEAKSLDYQAARDTSSSSSSKQSGSVEAKAKLVGSAGAELSGAYDQNRSSSSSSTARAGGINAGGNATVRTKNDARFEGTDISAGQKSKVESTSGNVTFDAAKSTTTSQSQGFNVNANIGTSKKAGKDGKAGERETEGGLGGGYSSSRSNATTSKGATIKGGEVDVSAAKDVTLEGTQVKSAGDTAVKAGGQVKLLEAKDSSKSSSIGVKADGNASKESQSGSVNVKAASEDKQTGTATRIESGGDTTIKGKSVTSQEAEVTSGGKTKVEGPVSKIQKTNVDKGMKLDLGVDAVRKSKADSKDKTGDTAKNSDKATDKAADDKAPGSEAKDATKAPVKAKTPLKPKKKQRMLKPRSPTATPPAGPAVSPAANEH